MNRKIISYILGALFFFLIVAAKPQQHQVEESAQHPQEHVDEQHADDQLTDDQHGEEQHEIKFDPGEFIFDHIGDAHEWHILTYKDFHLSIPLPVILYSESKGLNVFFFNKFSTNLAHLRPGFGMVN